MPDSKDLKIVAFVGMPGCGKGTCTNYLHDKHGWPVVHFGNMVYEEVQRRGLDNIKDEQAVREDMRKTGGLAVLAKHAARRAEEHAKNGETRVVFDGLYSWSEYKYLNQVFSGNLTVIAIAAPRQERHRRILARKDGHRKYTSAQQISDREIAEIENLEKGGPIAYADYTIANDGTPEQMLTKLDEILKEINII